MKKIIHNFRADNLMKYGNLDIPEWRSILMQVIMNLLMFQKSLLVHY